MPHAEGALCLENQSQLTIAENLCATCSYEAVSAVQPATAARRVEKAWRLSEFAIATTDAEEKYKSLNTATTLLLRAKNERSHFVTQNKALMLYGLMPALIDRAWRRPIQPESKRHANRHYGEVLVDRYRRLIFCNKGLAPEALVLYLLSRSCAENIDFYYLASPREETQNKKRKNHDIYKIGHLGADRKNPIQLKSSHVRGGYDVPVLNITAALKPVLELLSDGSLHPIMNFAAYERLDRHTIHQEMVLDFATHCLLGALKDMAYIGVE